MLVTSEIGRRLGPGLRWQSRHQLMLRGCHLRDLFHLVDPAVAGDAADACRHVHVVREIGVVGKLVDANPAHRPAAGGAVPNRCEQRAVLLHGQMAVHARLRGRNIRDGRRLDRGVTVSAIETELADVELVAVRDGLIRTVADVRVPRGKEVTRFPRSRGSARGRRRWRPRSGACSTKGERSGPLARISGAPEASAQAASPGWIDATSSRTEEFFVGTQRFQHSIGAKSPKCRPTRGGDLSSEATDRGRSARNAFQCIWLCAKTDDAISSDWIRVGDDATRVDASRTSLLTLCEKFHIMRTDFHHSTESGSPAERPPVCFCKGASSSRLKRSETGVSFRHESCDALGPRTGRRHDESALPSPHQRLLPAQYSRSSRFSSAASGTVVGAATCPATTPTRTSTSSSRSNSATRTTSAAWASIAATAIPPSRSPPSPTSRRPRPA